MPAFNAGLRLARWLGRRPFSWRWRLARWLAALHLRGDRRFRELSAVHVTLAFPDLPLDARIGLVRAHAVEYFFALLDRFRLWQTDADGIAAQVQLRGLEHLYTHWGRTPVVLLCPHFVGIDALAQRLALEGSMMTLYRPGSDAGFEALRRAARGRFHAQHLVPVGAPLFGLVRRLRMGVPLFLLPDVDVGSQGAVFSPFLGAQASTSLMGAWAVSRLGAVVLPVSVQHCGEGRYTAQIGSALTDLPTDPQALTDRFNDTMAQLVRESPQHYWWTNPRFVTRPVGQAPIYSDAVGPAAAAAPY